MNRMGYRALVGVATALLAAVYAPAVMAQTTFTACRVPAVGVLYLLNDALDPCLDAAHVKFSWTDGGAPPDGSITTAKIANSAVTIAKLSGGGAPVSGYEYVQATGVNVGASNGWTIDTPNCPSGKLPINGGFQAPYSGPGTMMYLFGSRPVSNHFNLFITNNAASAQLVTTWTLCAQVSAASAS